MMLITAISNADNLSVEQYDNLLRVISDSRKDRVKRFLRREDACRSIVGEALARYCISKFWNIPALAIEFLTDEFGKPHVSNKEKIHFSISHSHEWVVCAVSNTPVGIDVEKIHKHDPGIAKRFFHEKECEYIESLPDSSKDNAFFELWTLKESYIKAIGKGLSQPLKSFCILPDSCQLGMEVFADIPIMHFKQYDIAPDYKCAA
jgi:4'-phosphopantetheinyl transferase